MFLNCISLSISFQHICEFQNLRFSLAQEVCPIDKDPAGEGVCRSPDSALRQKWKKNQIQKELLGTDLQWYIHVHTCQVYSYVCLLLLSIKMHQDTLSVFKRAHQATLCPQRETGESVTRLACKAKSIQLLGTVCSTSQKDMVLTGEFWHSVRESDSNHQSL